MSSWEIYTIDSHHPVTAPSPTPASYKRPSLLCASYRHIRPGVSNTMSNSNNNHSHDPVKRETGPAGGTVVSTNTTTDSHTVRPWNKPTEGQTTNNTGFTSANNDM